MREVGLANALMYIIQKKGYPNSPKDRIERVKDLVAYYHKFDDICFPDSTKYDKARWKEWMGE